MSDFLSFTLENIRNGGAFMAWLESRRLEWAPLMAARLKYLLEGRTFVLMCDEQRSWYEELFLKYKFKSHSSHAPFCVVKFFM